MRRTADKRAVGAEDVGDADWWRRAVFYQVYVRSFADSDGDGVGDLEGIRSRLGYLELLGVDALWLTPFYRSPMADHGYDVSDPRDVDPSLGNMATFDTLVADAHRHGIRIVVDLVPNHTSSQHPWFAEALRAGPGTPARDRYIFREGRGLAGSEPPNNWVSSFGGPAWTQVSDGQWYLHIFSAGQPDLNWENPEVREDVEYTMRFWLDRGADGFRIDVAHGMAKPQGLPDMEERVRRGAGAWSAQPVRDPRVDNDGVHDIHRGFRALLDSYRGRVAVGEMRVRDRQRFARYLRQDELHLGFDFRLAEAGFDAADVRTAIEASLAAVAELDSPPTWTLANHDLTRQVTRYGDGRIGQARARAMILVELALPGVVCLYNGEELGLPDVELPEWALVDPRWEASGHTDRGRDGARVPMPWESDEAPFGFSTAERTWLPVPNEWGPFTVESQLEDTDSMLSLYRRALDLRKRHEAFRGGELEWYGAPQGCFAFRRKSGGLICVLNTSDGPVPLPQGEVLLSSVPVVDGRLPQQAAAWLA